MEAHPDYAHRQWLAEKVRIKACREAGHRRLPGQTKCDDCHIRQYTDVEQRRKVARELAA